MADVHVSGLEKKVRQYFGMGLLICPVAEEERSQSSLLLSLKVRSLLPYLAK